MGLTLSFFLICNRVTVVAFGQTGAGKSEFLNAYLRRASAFETDSTPDSVTFRTSSQESFVDGVTRIGIDTQGIDDTNGIDSAHVQQMVEFLRAYQHGVNTFALVINGQADRFDAGTKKMVKILHNFFNNSDFWNHVAIVFTKCYAAVPMNHQNKEIQYRARVQEIIVECAGADAHPLLPVFFVDSLGTNDIDTQNNFAAFHAFAFGLTQLSTQNVAVPNTTFSRVDLENETIETSRRTEPIIERRKTSRREFMGVIGRRIKHDVHVGDKVFITFQERQREKRTHYDGTISYGN